MKKVLFILCSLFVFATVTYSQTTEAKTQTKEEKQKAKEKQQEEMAAAYKEAGLTDDQIKQVEAAMKEASEKGKPIKNDATLSEDDKKAKLKEISDEKNAKIKEIMGADKYKIYSATRKKQKEAGAAGN